MLARGAWRWTAALMGAIGAFGGSGVATAAPAAEATIAARNAASVAHEAFSGPPRSDAAERAVSIHELELRAHDGEGVPARILPTELPRPRDQSLPRVVYGYYPFWVADLTTIRWSTLTHLAWFSIDLNGNGDVVSAHGWPDPEVVAVAHAAGVRVDLTFTLFGGADIQNLCSEPARRAKTIDTMVDLMEQGGADGISVDFEFVNGETRATFVAFIDELRTELDARGHAGAEISIAGPTVDWAGGIDLPALLDRADWYFVMGYGYFWSGSSHAGPGGMLRVTDEWAPYQSQSMLRTIATYSSQIEAAQRKQIIWGVPYYGRHWLTTSGAKASTTIESGGAVTYSAARDDLASGTVESLWDDGVKNPWYRWQSAGAWNQVYFDDAESLAAKYDLALAQDLGGVGMWALNYDKPHADLWDLLEVTFEQLPAPPEGHRDHPIAIETMPFHDERDTTVGPSHYFNHYGCAPEVGEWGREWVYSIDVCQPGTIEAKVPAYPDRDPDLHLLSAPDQEACLARAHTDLETVVAPGRYLLVVDTFVAGVVEQEGSYALDVDFVPEPGTEGCAPHLTCDAGSCVCPGAGEMLCGETCTDVTSDPDHCGDCNAPCAGTCVAGQCDTGAGGANPDPEADPPPGASFEGEVEAGCACRTPPRSSRPGWPLALVGLALTLGRRRRSTSGRAR